MSYITIADIEARIGKQTVIAICDDDNDGEPDYGVLEGVIRDATGYVNGFLRGIYPIPLPEPIPDEVKRLTLDVAQGYLANRHAEYVRYDGGKLLEQARKELMDLRTGKTRLDVMGAPEPAANQGGKVMFPVRGRSPERPRFFDDLGDW